MPINKLYRFLPEDKIKWDLILNELLFPFKKALEKTEQEKKWHGEGNVLIHTKMVCERLIQLSEYQALEKNEKLVLFLSALFHDVAKPVCTKIENGEIRSPNHGPTGACITREYLWKSFNLCGNNLIEFREGICLLIKYHTTPVHIDDNDEGIKKIIKLSLNQKLTKYFSIKNLVILSKADILGRISNQEKMHLDEIKTTIDLAKRIGCFDKPFEFNNSFSKIKYLNQNNVWYHDCLYDDTWGEVILMSGLPGVGKDTYISNHFGDMKVISLDEIRSELKVLPTDNQGPVINEGVNRAKELLRKKIPFIWNATNTSALNRKKLFNIIKDYHARVKIIYLEAPYSINIDRNNKRERVVPKNVIDRLIRQMEIPEDFEAFDVIWLSN